MALFRNGEMEHLVKGFEAAGLKCIIEKAPLDGHNPQIFQLDVGRKLTGNRREEFFRVWPGRNGTIAEITGTDKELGQVMLLVKEPSGVFEQRVPQHYNGHTREEFLRNNRVSEKDIIVRDGLEYAKLHVTGAKRHYLCGLDERQLFIAQIKKPCSTVREAHEDLKSTITFAEGRAPGRTKRQGEWFFVNPTEVELKMLKDALKAGRITIEKKVAIGSGGKPHIADELVRTPGLNLWHGFPVRNEETFVRGAIHHPDHSTTRFKEWRKAIRNNEGATAVRSNGVYWID